MLRIAACMVMDRVAGVPWRINRFKKATAAATYSVGAILYFCDQRDA